MRYWAPFILYSALILFVSTRPMSQLPRFSLNDKLLHFAEYTLYGALLSRLLLQRLRRQWLVASLWTLLGVALFALFDETVQQFARGRQTDLWDWVADMLGGACGIGLYLSMRGLVDRMRSEP